MDSVSSPIDSLRARIHNAKAFLRENPTEKIAAAAVMFELSHSTLYNSLARDKKPKSRARDGKHGGQNKILKERQEKAVKQFIQSLLMYSIKPSYDVVYNAIVSLKHAQNPGKKAPSKRWFSTWWKNKGLHKIKTKPIAAVRFTAAQKKDVKAWFVGYRKVLKALEIRDKKNVINFDEAGFRVGCMKGHEILVPIDIKEFYEVSPENRKSLTIFECIDAAGNPPPPPLIVIQGQDIMMDWFPEGLPAKSRIIPSENGFTSDKIALEYLQHYINNSDSGPEADWKLMLMDNYGSHLTPEFILLANANHIRPYPFIPHLTYCMQPLDVGIFQPYKHWHDMAIQDALLEFNIDYTLRRFLQDLTKIRDNTFKKGTIWHAFKKSGMWPPNVENCIKQLKTFNPGAKTETTVEEPSLPTVPWVQPKSLVDMEIGLDEWHSKVKKGMIWSDPARPEEFDTFVSTSKDLCTEGTFKDVELSMHRKRRQDEIQAKSRSRKRLQPINSELGVTKEAAEKMIAEKEKKEAEAEAKKQHNAFLKIWQMERDTVIAAGVAARKENKARQRKFKELQKELKKQGLDVPADSELRKSIPDPEAEWKATDVTWLALQAKKAKESQPAADEKDDDGEEVTFITDTVGDPTLRQDFILFEEGGDGGGSKFGYNDHDSDSNSDEDVQEQQGYY